MCEFVVLSLYFMRTRPGKVKPAYLRVWVSQMSNFPLKMGPSCPIKWIGMETKPKGGNEWWCSRWSQDMSREGGGSTFNNNKWEGGKLRQRQPSLTSQNDTPCFLKIFSLHHHHHHRLHFYGRKRQKKREKTSKRKLRKKLKKKIKPTDLRLRLRLRENRKEEEEGNLRTWMNFFLPPNNMIFWRLHVVLFVWLSSSSSSLRDGRWTSLRRQTLRQKPAQASIRQTFTIFSSLFLPLSFSHVKN